MKNWKKTKEKFFPLLVPKLNLGTSKIYFLLFKEQGLRVSDELERVFFERLM